MKGRFLITGLLAAALSAGAAHAAEDAHHAEASAGLPQFDPSTFTSQVFWLAIAFALSYLIFSKKVLPAIGAVLQTRSQTIEDAVRRAQDLRTQVESMKTSYESGLVAARSGATRLMEETQAGIKQRSEQALRDFQQRSERDIAALETQIAAEKTKVMAEMAPIVAEIARTAAGTIVGVTADAAQARNVVDALNRRQEAA